MPDLSPHISFSQPADTNAALQQALVGRGDALDAIPTIPAILQTLIAELDQPAEKVNLIHVAELIGRDDSLAAQCLRMANSALYGRGKRTSSLRGAVRTLGISHVRDAAISCAMIRIVPSQTALDPVIFWEHSLGCAILSRKLARSIGFDDPDKAYLAGLLHDVGYIVNMILWPAPSKTVFERASRENIFAGECEFSELGFTHCQSGELLARKWNFSSEIVEAIQCHHDTQGATIDVPLVAIVALADRLCRSSGLGLGYAEIPDPALLYQYEWKLLTERFPLAKQLTWSEFVKDSDAYFAEIRDLVTAMYQGRS